MSAVIPVETQTPEVKALVASTEHMVEVYRDYTVANATDYAAGATNLKTIKTLQQQLEEQRKAITRPMDAAKAAVLDFFRPFATRLDLAELRIKNALLTWKDAEDKRVAEQQRIENERAEKAARELREKAAEADRIAAEKERKRLADEQRKADEKAEEERQRIAAEQAAAKTETDKRRADEQAAAERKRREAEQERLHKQRLDVEAEQRDHSARAENLEERADVVTSAPLARRHPRSPGSPPGKVAFEITDPAKVPEQYKTIDLKKIGGVVRALKGDTDIPGVRAYSESTMAAGRA